MRVFSAVRGPPAPPGAGLAVDGAVERVEVGLPLPGEERLLLVVAVLAGRDHVGADRAAPAHQRDHVVEGEGLRPHRPAAVMTEAGGDAPAPPSGLPQRARPCLLAPECFVVDLARVAIGAHRASPETAESRIESSSHSFMSQATRSSVSFRAWAISRARGPSR